MNINDAFPSNYLKAADMADEDMTLVIKSVETEEIGQGKDASTKPVLYFRGNDKGLILNKTNSNTVANLYGPETDNWIGKPITMFATEVDFQGKQVLSIRIRMRKPAAKPGGQQSRPPVAAAKTQEEEMADYVSEAFDK